MSENTPSINLLFINGKIGSGKGTMAPRLLRAVPQSCLISTGDIYRGAKKGVGEYAQFHSDVIPYVDLVDNHGGLIPDEVMVPIVGVVLARKIDEGFTTFVFDGFPRTVPQLDETDEMIGNLGHRFGERGVTAEFVCLATTDRISLGRVESRRLSKIRKGEDLRPEDDPEKAKERLSVYYESGKTSDMLHRLVRECRLTIVRGNYGSTDEWRRLKRALELGQTNDRELPRAPHGKES